MRFGYTMDQDLVLWSCQWDYNALLVYNSPEVPGENSCERLVPIMGQIPERELDCATHNFSHRMESAMRQVYGSWEQIEFPITGKNLPR